MSTKPELREKIQLNNRVIRAIESDKIKFVDYYIDDLKAKNSALVKKMKEEII